MLSVELGMCHNGIEFFTLRSSLFTFQNAHLGQPVTNRKSVGPDGFPEEAK